MKTNSPKNHDVNHRTPSRMNDEGRQDNPRRKLVVRLLPVPGADMSEMASVTAADLIRRGCDVFTLDCRSMEEAPPPPEIRSKYAAHLGLPPAPMPANAAEYGEVDPASPPTIELGQGHQTSIAEILRTLIEAADRVLDAAGVNTRDDGSLLRAFYNSLESARQAVDDERDVENCFANCCDDCHRLYHAAERVVRSWDAFELIAEVPSLSDPAKSMWEDALHAAAEILWMTTGQAV